MHVLSSVCALQLIESPPSLVQMFYDLQRKIACCSDGTLAQNASNKISFERTPWGERGSGAARAQLRTPFTPRLPFKGIFVLIRTLIRLDGVLFDLDVVLMELLRKMPHQNIRLDSVLSHSG